MDFHPSNPSATAERALTGDLVEAPTAFNQVVSGGALPPDFGDLLDIGGGDIYPEEAGLLAMGDLSGRPGVQTLPSARGIHGLHSGASSNLFLKAGTARHAPGKTVEATLASGIIDARERLAIAGIGRKGAQDAVISSGMQIAQLEQLGRRALGKVGANDMMPFYAFEKGRLVTTANIRNGAGARASTLKVLLDQQLVNTPYRNWIYSGVPGVGATIDLTSVITANSNVYPVLYFIVIMSNTFLNTNPSKVLGVQFTVGTNSVVSQTYQTYRFQYHSDGVAQFMMVPAYEVMGNYYPQLVFGQNTGVAATTRNLMFTVTGNDGTNDNLTVIAIGPDDEYYRRLQEQHA